MNEVEDIVRPPYFGTPENPQDWFKQYYTAFLVGNLIFSNGAAASGWVN